jgi:hypothetical protein
MEAYRKLMLGPEATETEVAEAKLELTNELKSRKADIDKQLEGVFQAVAGLREATAEVARLKQLGEQTSLDELGAAQAALAQLEERARSVEPKFLSLREEAADLERQIHDVNLSPIGNSKDRQSYDQANPPLELLKLADCRTDFFSDNAVALRLLRREVEAFLQAAGEPLSYPTDLTREDFTSDFTFNRNLDGPHP